MSRLSLLIAAATLSLSACAPAPAPVQPVAPVMPVETVTPVSGVAGLEERQPDLCHAKDYISALGQPGTVIAGLGITRPFRVVEFRGIEPQEYNPQRIVFRLDQAGNIQNIDCG